MKTESTSYSIDVEELLKLPQISIFGYGSLIWRPGFDYDSHEMGFIRGYLRRFYQGSTHHRGTEENPGRVLTAVENKDGCVYGVTYTVRGRERILKALEALGVREVVLGGYSSMMIDFYPATNNYSARNPSCKAILYIALPSNPLFCGAKSELQIAQQVANAEGVCGHNSEYIFKLALFMKKNFPDIREPHLYEVDLHLERCMAGKEAEKVKIKRSIDFNSSLQSQNAFEYEDGEDLSVTEPEKSRFQIISSSSNSVQGVKIAIA